MRFLVIVKEGERDAVPPEDMTQMFEAMGKFNEELVKAGMMLAAEGLTPTSDGFRIKYEGPKRTIIDGPFAESKELVAGFWILQAKSRDEVTEWMERAPFDGGTEIEIRPIAEAEDLGDAFTPELRAAEERMRAEIAAQQGKQQP